MKSTLHCNFSLDIIKCNRLVVKFVLDKKFFIVLAYRETLCRNFTKRYNTLNFPNKRHTEHQRETHRTHERGELTGKNRAAILAQKKQEGGDSSFLWRSSSEKCAIDAAISRGGGAGNAAISTRATPTARPQPCGIRPRGNIPAHTRKGGTHGKKSGGHSRPKKTKRKQTPKKKLL